MEVQKPVINLPQKFIMNSSFVVWGIVGLLMAVWFGIIGVVGDNIHSQKDLYTWIGLVLFMALSGTKLLTDGLKLRLLVEDDKITAKTISGYTTIVYWKDITSVTLVKKPPVIVLKDAAQSLTIPLKLKRWEKLFMIIEDKVDDKKFVDFT